MMNIYGIIGVSKSVELIVRVCVVGAVVGIGTLKLPPSQPPLKSGLHPPRWKRVWWETIPFPAEPRKDEAMVPENSRTPLSLRFLERKRTKEEERKEERGERKQKKRKRAGKEKGQKRTRKVRQSKAAARELRGGVPRRDLGGLRARNSSRRGGDAHIAARFPSCSFLARRVSRIQGSRLSGDLGSAPSPPPLGAEPGPAPITHPEPAARWGSASPAPQSDFSLSAPGQAILGGAAALWGRPPPRSVDTGAAPGPHGARPDAARRRGSRT